MASVERRAKQVATNNAYYINVAPMARGVVQNVNSTDEAPQLSTVFWADQGATSTALAVAGNAVLRDMGKNLVSSGRVFRKVQLLGQTAPALSTGGVIGAASGAASDYLVGYIELPGLQGSASGGVPAKVARLG